MFVAFFVAVGEFGLAISYEAQAPPVAHYATPFRQLVFGSALYLAVFVLFRFRGADGKSALRVLLSWGLLMLLCLESMRQVSRHEVLVGSAPIGRFDAISCGELREHWFGLTMGPNTARFYLPIPIASDRLAGSVGMYFCDPSR
jgi:hypothetical protein